MKLRTVTRQPFELKTEKRIRRVLRGAGLLLLIGGIWGVRIAGDRTDRQMRRDLLRETINIAAAIPAEEAARLTFSKEDAQKPEFRRMSSQLKAFANAREIRSLYTMGLKAGQIVFGPESLDPDDPYASAPGTVYENPTQHDFDIFQTGQPTTQGPVTDEYGTFVSAGAPVIDPRTGEVILVVGCDVEASAWKQAVHSAQIRVFLIAELPLLILLAGWALTLYRGWMAPATTRRLRHTEAVTCATAMLLLTLGGATLLHQADRTDRQNAFSSIAQLKAEAFATEFNNLTTSLDGLAALFGSSESVSYEEFDTYCKTFTGRHPIRGYRWGAVVPAETADAFEKHIRTEPGFEPFRIWEHEAGEARGILYPIVYVSPITGHEHFVGFDLSSNPVRSTTVRTALKTGLMTASTPTRPISNQTDAPGVLICRSASSGEQQGFVSMFLQPDELIQQISRSTTEDPTPLCAGIFHLQKKQPPAPMTKTGLPWKSTQKMRLVAPFFLFGQTYAIVIYPSDEWLAAHPLTHAKIAWGIGLILTVLGTALVSTLANRPALLEELVLKRTRELHRSEQYNRAIFDSTNDAIFVHDAETLAIVDTNDAAERMFGLPRSELLHTTVDHLSSGEPPYTRNEAEHRIKEALAGRPQLFDWHSKSSDGTLFWSEVSLHQAKVGTNSYVIAAIRNVEARRRVEEAIRRSEYRFEIAAQAGKTGIWDLELKTNHLTWDARMHQIYGTQPEEFGSAYQPWQQALHPDDTDRVSAEMADALRGDTEFNTEFRIVRPNGEVRHIQASAELIRDNDGAPLRMIGATQDITEQKKAEAELLRLSTAIEQSPESVIITDPDGIILYVNPAFEEVTGYSKEDALGRNQNFLNSEQEPEAFLEDIRRTLKQGNVWTGRLSCKRKSGTIRTEESVISPVKDPHGEITHYVAVQRDITEELAHEAQLQQAQKMEAVGQLAGGIAHDFNNILQAILGFSELLMLTLKEDDTSSRDSVKEIQKAGRHAADLTRQLLAFSRKQPPKVGRLDLNSLLTDATSILTSITGENIHIRTDMHPDLVEVNADRQQMERVLINLCINARDAMPAGGDLILRTHNAGFTAEDAAASPEARAGDFACLSVSDTGTGMSEETIKHIFEPFFSTKAPGKGTGLGLAAIYGIVQEHNGWINVYSEPGRGSSFKIYLPALHSNESSNGAKAGAGAKEESPRGTGHILIVEDDLAVRTLSKTALERAGYIITEAESAEEAEELYTQAGGKFDLLFSDVILPGKNGAELAASILEKDPNLPILLCSGYSGDRIRNAGIDKKGFHFLEKPSPIVHLLKTVHRILGAR